MKTVSRVIVILFVLFGSALFVACSTHPFGMCPGNDNDDQDPLFDCAVVMAFRSDNAIVKEQTYPVHAPSKEAAEAVVSAYFVYTTDLLSLGRYWTLKSVKCSPRPYNDPFNLVICGVDTPVDAGGPTQPIAGCDFTKLTAPECTPQFHDPSVCIGKCIEVTATEGTCTWISACNGCCDGEGQGMTPPPPPPCLPAGALCDDVHPCCDTMKCDSLNTCN